MKERLKRYTKEILIFIVTLSIFANLISFYKSGDLNKNPLADLNFTLIDNSTYSLSKKEHSRPILLHFWATWCPTCSLEAANIQSISEEYEVLTIAVKSSKENIQDYMRQNNLNFKVVNDNEGLLASKFQIAAYPTTFIYDKDRNLLFSEVGYTSTFGLWIRMVWAEIQ